MHGARHRPGHGNPLHRGERRDHQGQSHQFTVVATTEDGREYSNELVTFLSDPFYLSVDENGLATGVRECNTRIRADAGKEAFSRCKSLKSLTILTKKLNAKNVGKKAFEGLNAKVKVRCPKGKAKAYEKLLKACGLPATATVE